MDIDSLTTARWELVNQPSELSNETRSVIRKILDAKIGYPLHVGPSEPIAPLPSASQEIKIALCLGHARSGDRGARALNGVYEEEFNLRVLRRTKGLLDQFRIPSEIISTYQGNDYGEAMYWLADYIKRNQFTLALEQHFNSYDGTAQGYEYLHWHRSTVGIQVAQIFLDTQQESFPSAISRGLKPLGDDEHDRGVLFTSLLHCPAVINEPFFGDHEEARSYMSDEGVYALASMNANAIRKSISIQHVG